VLVWRTELQHLSIYMNRGWLPLVPQVLPTMLQVALGLAWLT
jgi:hypothetical protein